MKKLIYADNAATTRLAKESLEAMLPWLSEEYGNPSTLYGFSRIPRKVIADSRNTIASVIGAKSTEVFFTSGGTESDNWALKGTAFRFPSQKKRIITSCIEHHAVLNSCAFLSKMGYDVSYLPVDQQGIVRAKDLEKAITDDTILVSVMLANNEIGTIEPVAKLAAVAHAHGVLFHTDAVQAVGHIPVDVRSLGVDMLSASAHKFNGPKGVGFLYVRNGVDLVPLLSGGSQEKGRRSGTENVAGIVGMAAALRKHASSINADALYIENLRCRLISRLRNSNCDFIINGSNEHIPGSVSLSFRNTEGELLLHRLDLMGIAVATGSACNSKETVLSHVIRAINVPGDYANGTIRITLGMDNDEAQVDQIASAIAKILRQ